MDFERKKRPVTPVSSENSESEDEKEDSRRKKKYRKQKFSDDWLQLPEFRGWLEKIASDQYMCKCKACNSKIVCGKSELLKHSRGKKHMEKVTSIQSNTSLTSYFIKKQNENEVKKVQNFEVRLSTFFAEHNVALQVVDHLVPLLKEIVPDSKIVQQAALGRKKCTGVIKNVIAVAIRNDLINVLKTTDFSVMVDESTDIGLQKTMCLLTRYVHPSNGFVKTELLDLIKLDAKDCTAENLYIHFRQVLTEADIPLKNIIGLASDGASVMLGANNSFASRLISEVPNVTVIRCICHTSAIIANKACVNLPRAPEELLRQISTYLSNSSKRCAQLEEIQEYFNKEKKKILKVASTRWLSLHQCINRILENWDVLISFFRVAQVDDKLKSAELILMDLENVCNKAYLLFLKYVLNYFNTLNALFQSKKPLVVELYNASKKLFLTLGQNFLKPEKLHPNVNVNDPSNYLNISDIFLGADCNNLLNTLPNTESHKIRLDCLNFYKTACSEIQKRLPIHENNFFENLRFLNPNIALDTNNNNRCINFTALCEKYEVDLNETVLEWRGMPFQFDNLEREIYLKKSLEEFWWDISKIKNFEDKLVFPNLSLLYKKCLTLPHSNADAERIFSDVTDIKTKKRNKLSHEVLNSICTIRSFLKSKELNCTTYQFDFNKISINSNILYDHKN